MTIRLTEAEEEEQFQEADEEELQFDPTDELDVVWKYDARFSQGWRREIDLREGISLNIVQAQSSTDRIIISYPEQEVHHIICNFILSGNGHWMMSAASGEIDIPRLAGKYCLRSNGLESQGTDTCEIYPWRTVNIFIHPSTLRSFTAAPDGELPSNLQHLIKPSDEEVYVRSGDMQPMMTAGLRQILNCPYQGMIKRAYLESKVIELTALVLGHEAVIQQGEAKKNALKPNQLERIHYAKEILLSDLSNPPSLENLARQAGLNDLLLRQGFRQVFGTTVFEILRSHRFELAKQLLAEQDLSVGEVAYRAGYTSVSSFSRAFEKRFGIRPKAYQKQCR